MANEEDNFEKQSEQANNKFLELIDQNYTVIIDISDLANDFLIHIRKLIPYRPELLNYNNLINSIFNESVNQIIMIMDQDLADFHLKLTATDNTKFFTLVSEYADMLSVQEFVIIYKNFATELFDKINSIVDKFNPDEKIDYFLESVNSRYIVLTIIKYKIGVYYGS